MLEDRGIITHVVKNALDLPSIILVCIAGVLDLRDHIFPRKFARVCHRLGSFACPYLLPEKF